MKTIDRYIARNFLFSYLVVLVGLVGLAIIIDASNNLDEFMELVPADLSALARAGRLLGIMGNWYGVHVLLFFQMLMPIITVVAAVVTVVMMKRRNELVPLLASGVSVYRALWPLILLALMASGVDIANRELVLPRVAHRLVRRPDDPHGHRPQRLYKGFTDAAGNRITASSYLPSERTLENVVINGPRTEGGRMTIFAERAIWNEPRRAWLLKSGRIQRTGAEERVDTLQEFGPDKPKPSFFFETSLRPADVDQPIQWIQFSAAGELRRRIALRPDLRLLRVELHGRYVLPLHAVILLLLGLPLVLMQESKSVIVGLGIAMVICLAYLGVKMICEHMGSDGDLEPILAVWLPIFIFGPVAIVLFDSVRT